MNDYVRDNYLEKILTSRVYDVARVTALEKAVQLSRRLGNEVLLKREDQQSVHSFKLRGAYNKMARLSPKTLKRGVITASAGNHAQGVALAAKMLKCEAVIVMPATTPSIKVNAVRNYGAKVVLKGDTYAQAYTLARTLARRHRHVFIHPFDDPDVIAGQGTIGMEILQQSLSPVHAIFVPVGGGGLAAGIAAYVKQIHPRTKVIGVEPVDANAMYISLKAGRLMELDTVGLFADGVAVRKAGVETFRLCRKYLDEIVLVDTDEICAAIKDVFDDARTIMEPSGALAVAGMISWAEKNRIENKTLVAVLSGANMNFYRLRHVAERAEVGEKREALIAVTIPERPGSFKQLINLLGSRMITEFNYRYNDPARANVFMGVSIHDRAEILRLLKRLKRHGFAAVDFTGNEMAILHLRHLVGGPAHHGVSEVFYRCEFPERVGALKDFLNSLSHKWNISLFHYRNHGTDYGRVLFGMQVPPGEKPLLDKSLNKLGYTHYEETQNPVCRLFLR